LTPVAFFQTAFFGFPVDLANNDRANEPKNHGHLQLKKNKRRILKLEGPIPPVNIFALAQVAHENLVLGEFKI
jgi:hypothetical protein